MLAVAGEARRHGHAEVLVPLTRRVLDEAGLGFADIDVYAVTVGPGGFTGIRIGLAAVTGMALAERRPMLGIDSFTASLATALADGGDAAGVVPEGSWLVALDSRRGDLFCRLLGEDLAALGPPAVVAPAALADWLGDRRPVGLTGNAAGAVVAQLGHDRFAAVRPAPAVDPARLALLAATRADRAGAAVPTPLYLREPDARLAAGP